MVELLGDEGVAEEDGVKEERLADHENEAEDGTGAAFAEHVAEDVAPGGVVARGDLELVLIGDGRLLGAFVDLAFDVVDDL